MDEWLCQQLHKRQQRWFAKIQSINDSRTS